MPNTNLKFKLILPVIIACAFFALAGEAEAATYYVDNNAPSCSNGVTNYIPATRTCGSGGTAKVFTTIANANSGIVDGTASAPHTVYIRSGKNYAYTGTAGPTLTRSYTTWRNYASDGAKPVLTGNYSQNFGNGNGLVKCENSSHVTLEGLELKEFGHLLVRPELKEDQKVGKGLWVEGVDDFTVRNCYIHHIGGGGIIISGGPASSGPTTWYPEGISDVLIENNLLEEIMYSALEKTFGSWNAGIYTRHDCRNVTIRGNVLNGIGGEGMNLAQVGTGFLIEYNVVINHRTAGFFINNIRNAICRYNLVYHDKSTRYSGWGTGGISIGLEQWGDPASWYDGQAHDIDIYGNMVVNCAYLFAISNAQDEIYNPYNIHFYNNIGVRGWENSYMISINTQPAQVGTGIEIMNNAILEPLSTGAIAGGQSLSKVTFDYNLWGKTPPPAAQGPNDPGHATGYGTLNTGDHIARSDWTSTPAGSLTGQEFAIVQTVNSLAKLIGKGTSNLSAPFNAGADYSKAFDLNAVRFDLLPGTQAWPLVDRDGKPWDIGADVFVTGGDTTAPAKPSNLSVR